MIEPALFAERVLDEWQALRQDAASTYIEEAFRDPGALQACAPSSSCWDARAEELWLIELNFELCA